MTEKKSIFKCVANRNPTFYESFLQLTDTTTVIIATDRYPTKLSLPATGNKSLKIRLIGQFF